MSRELTTVTRSHSLLLSSDWWLLALQPLSFTARQRTRVNALLNTLLLIDGSLVNANARRRSGDLPVVLVRVNRVTCAIFTSVEYGAITSGEFTTIPSPHPLFLGGNRALLPFQPLRFARS
jgi:hypothetical protein